MSSNDVLTSLSVSGVVVPFEELTFVSSFGIPKDAAKFDTIKSYSAQSSTDSVADFKVLKLLHFDKDTISEFLETDNQNHYITLNNRDV